MKWPEYWAPPHIILWRALWIPFIFVSRELFLFFVLIGQGYDIYEQVRNDTR